MLWLLLISMAICDGHAMVIDGGQTEVSEGQSWPRRPLEDARVERDRPRRHCVTTSSPRRASERPDSAHSARRSPHQSPRRAVPPTTVDG